MNFILASSCAEAYFETGNYPESLKWHMYCYLFSESAGLDESAIHASAIGKGFGKIKNTSLAKKYMRIACDLGHKSSCQ